MKLELNDIDLKPLIEQVVCQTLRQLRAVQTEAKGRISYTESEAAAMLGVARHALRDARLRGELTGSRVGKRIVYARDELIAFLERNRVG